MKARTRCDIHKAMLKPPPRAGHVDFTFEVERALRVLDGAVEGSVALPLCDRVGPPTYF